MKFISILFNLWQNLKALLSKQIKMHQSNYHDNYQHKPNSAVRQLIVVLIFSLFYSCTFTIFAQASLLKQSICR